MNWSIIKTENKYQEALKRLDKIFQPKNSKEQDEFDLLVMLVNKYEHENYKIEEVDPIQVLKAKMKYFDLKQKDLIKYFGSKATTSKIMTYKSPLTLKHVWILSQNLKIPIELLAKPYKVDHWAFMKKFKNKGVTEIKVAGA